MALVVFLRGVNVGGHRTFRPRILAEQLSDYEVVNVGATGTFVVRRPGPRGKFRKELLTRLPFAAEVVICDSGDVLALEGRDPFGNVRSRGDAVRFVSILSRASRRKISLPLSLPPTGDWFVRVIGREGRFVFGLYRRQMKTIGYLGQLDKVLGAPVTTRSWTTMTAILGILKGAGR